MDIEKDSNREAFEAWFESRYDANFMQFALDFDMYVDKHTQASWEAWQAAKASASEKLKQVINNLNNIKASEFRPHHYDYDKGWRDCAVTVLNDLKAQEQAND